VRKTYLGLWSDKHDWEAEREPESKIALLRIKSVHAHPALDDAFLINEVTKSNGETRSYTFFHVDRSRDVWVQTLTLLINNERERKNKSESELKKGRSTRR